MRHSIFRTCETFILASASPRRQQMLKALGLSFIVKVVEVDETVKAGEHPEKFVTRISLEKAKAASVQNSNAWILAADTIVVIGSQILGKPENSEHAFSMLKRLVGQEHDVWSGFSLCHHSNKIVRQRAVCTKVKFSQMSDALINAYVDSNDPLDKAGAYGIQSMGGFMVESISGSYSNVVGLPMAEIVEELCSLNIICPLTQQ